MREGHLRLVGAVVCIRTFIFYLIVPCIAYVCVWRNDGRYLCTIAVLINYASYQSAQSAEFWVHALSPYYDKANCDGLVKIVRLN